MTDNPRLLAQTCRFEGCETHAYRGCQGYCVRHYQRLQRAGTLERKRAKHGERTLRQCKFPGCDTITAEVVKGYCPKHYRRLSLHGDPAKGGRPDQPTEEMKRDILASYAAGDSAATIAEAYGRKKATITLWLHKWGATLRPVGFRIGHVPKRKTERKGNGTGYILIRAESHPFASKGFVPEHRLIAEGVIGRYLQPNEVVHHINNDPSDNRPENLQVMTNAEHTRLHKGRKRTRSGPGTFSIVTVQCSCCQQIFKRRIVNLCRVCRPEP